jgi:hypothetical protein
MLRVKLIKIARYDQCALIENAATLALNQFQQRYTQEMITNDPLLQSEETRLTAAKTKAWNDRFAAESAAYPPTLESILWIVAKSGYTKEVARFMNLSKTTRECKNLQRYMREVMNRSDESQLHYYCMKGLTSSVKRMLEMKSIDVEARQGGREDGWTCLMIAARNGYLDICGLLIDKGAQIEAKESDGWTRFILLLFTATLRLFACWVIAVQMLNHAITLDGGHYIKQPVTDTSLSLKELQEMTEEGQH